MQTAELGFFTTQELIQELMARKTFLGMVIHSSEELKREWSGERTFKVHINENLEASQASRLLEVLAERMEQPNESFE